MENSLDIGLLVALPKRFILVQSKKILLARTSFLGVDPFGRNILPGASPQRSKIWPKEFGRL